MQMTNTIHANTTVMLYPAQRHGVMCQDFSWWEKTHQEMDEENKNKRTVGSGRLVIEP